MKWKQKAKQTAASFLAAAVLAGSLPVSVGAQDFLLSGKTGTETVQEKGAEKPKEQEAEQRTTEGGAEKPERTEILHGETSKEETQTPDAPKAEEPETGDSKPEASQPEADATDGKKEDKKQEKETEADIREKKDGEDTKNPEKDELKDQSAFLKDGKKQYGSPEDEPYDFTGIVPNTDPPEIFDPYEYDPMENEPEPFAVEEYEELQADIAKRVEWVDKTNGNGKVTLNYSSNSGSYSGSEDLNVVLVQDKSGSMDPNYGFNIALVDYNLNINNGKPRYYPDRTGQGWSENSADCVGEEYMKELNNSSTGIFWGNMMWHQEMQWNSPCQHDGHYYQMIESDPNSTALRAGQMVHGNNLQNISHTDIHHYVMLANKAEALSYLAGGRRVMRCKEWVDKKGYKQTSTDDTYFLDITEIWTFQGKDILNTCALTERDEMGKLRPVCEGTNGSRLRKSQWFMDKLVKDVKRLNPANKIAYVPFWGDVPNNGSWSNASSNGSTTNIFDDNNDQEGARRQTYKAGVTSIGLTSSAHFDDTIKPQIDNAFTYAGTNWTRALQKTIDILNGRSAEDKQKKTLVLFLTDGQPQGTAGKPTDVDNLQINGKNQIKTLKGMSGVTVYACGVGINQKDASILSKINEVDSKGKAHRARTVEEFDTLYQEVYNRLNEDFYIPITGKETFYTDRLSGNFSLNEDALDSSWKVLAAPGSGTTKGVPTDVYNAVKNNSAVKHVYVRSTKTVYWYIGEMTDGGYSTSGHSFSFPIKYSGYNTSTGAKDTSLQANSEQKLTYVSSANVNRLLTVTLSTPSLVFHREDLPTLTVKKTLEGSHFTTDQTYQFAYCKTKQSGKIVSREGTVSVTVKAGETTASTVVKDVKPGTYYVYEIDANNNIISAQEETATVAMTPAISTTAKSASVPASATTTDGQNLANSNNYLKIVRTNVAVSFTNAYLSVKVEKKWDDSNSSRRPGQITVHLKKNGTVIADKNITKDMDWTYTFENLVRYDAAGKEITYTVQEDPIKHYKTETTYKTEGSVKTATLTNTLMVADLTVQKTIPSDADTIWWGHGDPTFMVKVSGTGLDGKAYTFTHTFVFTREEVEKLAKNGTATLSYTFKDIPNSTNYKCEELTVSRWRLNAVTGNGSNVTVTKGDTPSKAAVFGIYANANVKAKPEGTAVTFENVKDDYQWFNHVTSVHNVIQKK